MVGADCGGQVAGAGYGLAVDGHDDVAGLKADLAGRRAGHDLLDEGALAAAGRARRRARRVGDPDAEEGAVRSGGASIGDPLPRLELGDLRLRLVDRDGEADVL